LSQINTGVIRAGHAPVLPQGAAILNEGSAGQRRAG